jgi:parallel beta-helix repeat protein
VQRGLLLAALAATAAALGTAGGAGAASILVVDDDFAQCPNAGYTDIAAAVGDATDGDTILVCPGTYVQTTIDRRLSLVGWTPALTSLNQCSDRLSFPADQTTKNTIVAGFVVDANFVSIRGFTLSDADNGVLVPGNISRTTVARNVIQDNAVGINLNGTNNDADHNCIRENNGAGSASGTGLYSDQGLKSTLIDQNLFFGNTAAAMTLLDAAGAGSLDDVHVTKNQSSQDGDLISLAGATSSEVAGNTATGSSGSGIFLQAGLGSSSTLVISKNKVSDGGDEGIFVDAGALTNSTIEKNTTTGNATYGIHVSAGNSGNTISKNKFKNIGANNDCQDDSVGGGTAGTDNTWKKNKGKTSFPVGICKK